MIITALWDVTAHKIVISNVMVNVFWNVQADRHLSRIATTVNVIWCATVRIVCRIAILVLGNAVCDVTANNNVRRIATMANVIWCATVRIVCRIAILMVVNAVCDVTANNNVRRYATMANVTWSATVRIVSSSAILVLVNAVCNATANNLVRRYATMVSVHWNAMDQTVRKNVTGIKSAASRSVKFQMTQSNASTLVSPTITSAPLLLLRRRKLLYRSEQPRIILAGIFAQVSGQTAVAFVTVAGIA